MLQKFAACLATKAIPEIGEKNAISRNSDTGMSSFYSTSL